MKAQGGVEIWLHSFITLAEDGGEWRWGVSLTLWPIYSRGKSTQYPLNRGLCRLQSQSGCCGEEKNILPLPGFEHNSLVVQFIAWSLYWLSSTGSK
jgi:hypothetical protein